MKTSKKILSFFLAVVMVVTTCSVGFTAFADEKNGSIWSTDANADAAYSALEALVDEFLPGALMGIDAISQGVYAKYAPDYGKDNPADLTDAEKEEINGKATTKDVVAALAPVIYGALGKTSQQDFANRIEGDGANASHYDYLQGMNGSLDFFTLYTLCEDYKDNQNLDKNSRDTLTEWYNQLKPLAMKYSEASSKAEADMGRFMEICEDVYAKLAEYYETGGDISSLSYYDISAKAEEFQNALNLSAEDEAIVTSYLSYYSDMIKKLGYDKELKNIGDILYYDVTGSFGTVGQYLVIISMYYDLIKTSGTAVTLQGEMDLGFGTVDVNITEDINPSNFSELFSEQYISQMGEKEFYSTVLGEEADLSNAEMIKRAKSIAEMAFTVTYAGIILGTDASNAYDSPYYREMILGLAVKSGAYQSAEEAMNDVYALMPTDEEYEASIPELQHILYEVYYNEDLCAEIFMEDAGKGYGYPYVTRWLDKNIVPGEFVFGQLPEGLRDTAFADYMARVYGEGVQKYFQGFTMALISKDLFTGGFTPNYAKDNNGNFLICENVRHTYITNAEFDSNAFNVYNDAAIDYTLAGIVQDAFKKQGLIGEDENYLLRNDATGLSNSELDIDSLAFLVNGVSVDLPVNTEFTDEEKKIFNADYNLANEVGVDVANELLNNTINGVINNATVSDLIKGLVDTDIDLQAALSDLMNRLYKSPVSTVVEILPILLVLVDEMVLPLVFNQEGDKGYNFLWGAGETELVSVVFGLLGLDISFHDFTYDWGSYVGIDQLGWDLNDLLPKLMNWLLASKADQRAENVEGITYYKSGTVTLQTFARNANGDTIKNEDGTFKSTDAIFTLDNFAKINFANYTVKDTDGNELVLLDDGKLEYNGTTYADAEALFTANETAQFKCYMTYDSGVPYLTGIYIADRALKDACIADLSGMLGSALGDETGGAILGEIITEVATLFSAAVEEFVATPEYRNETRYRKDGLSAFSGLNNFAVAIPRLFDIMENLAAEKYGVDENAWVYCYEGRIATKEIEGKTSTVNSFAEEIKGYAGSNKDDRAVDILDCFVELFIESWMNGIISIVNSYFSTDNKITSNIPIISGLLNAFGGFGEMSIFTDIFNSIFQLTRESEYSFTFSDENSDENNKLTGLSKDNAYFLITNIPRLIEVITNLIAHFNTGDTQANAMSLLSDDAADDASDESKAGSPVYDYAKAAESKAAKALEGYSSSDLSNAKDLLNNLDKMLSSLLSDSSLNGFSLDTTENIITGIVSLLDNFLGLDVNVGDELGTKVVVLLNQYLYYITGKSENIKPEGGNVDPEKVYTNDALTGLVVESYALIEQLAEALLADYTDSYDNNDELTYNLLVEAIDGLVAPDAISIRLTSTDEHDYSDAQKKIAKYSTWTEMAEASSRNGFTKLRIDWDFKDGDKEGFYDGFTASLRLVTTLVGVLLIETEWYDTIVEPVLGAMCDKNDVEVTPYEELVADYEKTGFYDATLIAVISPVTGWLDALLKAPVTTVIQSLQGFAGIIDEQNREAGTIGSIVAGAIRPIAKEIKGIAAIFNLKTDKLGALSPTLADFLSKLEIEIAGTKVPIMTIIDAVTVILPNTNLVSFALGLLGDFLDENFGIKLKLFDFEYVYEATPEAALVYVLEYVLDILLDENVLALLAELINDDVVKTIIDALLENKVTSKDLLGLINQILEITDSPTLAYWTFAQYLQVLTENFKYPIGITKKMADEGVASLDNIVEQIFPLLGSFGVDIGGENLNDIVSNNLFTNDLLTKAVTGIYGGLEKALAGQDPMIKTALSGIGFVFTTKDVAKLLTDKSYGATFSSAAKAISAQSSWSNVKNLNWGFKDGTSKAQQGFINALAAILRPFNTALNVFLGEGTLELNNVIDKLITSLNVPETKVEAIVADGFGFEIVYSMKNGVFTLTIDDPTRERSAVSTLKLDLNSLKDMKSLKIEGTNAYNSAIIPLLEVFGCSDIKTYSQYQKDIDKAKDNLLIDILNPLIGTSSSSLLNRVIAAPFDEITKLLPNLAMYIEAEGLSQLVFNLLAPVTQLVAQASEIVDIQGIIEDQLLGGQSLGNMVADLLGYNGKIDLDLKDLSKLNLSDLIVPIIRTVIANEAPDLKNLKIYDIKWDVLIGLGTKGTYTSHATGADGNYLTGKIVKNVDQGKVLITVLRYVAKTLIANTGTIKTLVGGIEDVKKNDMLKSILNSVFNTIGMASADQLVAAIFYLIASEPTNAFWDYTGYKTAKNEFAYPESVDEEFLKTLPAMLDGLIGGLADLNKLVTDNLYKDSIITSLAKGLYGAVEGVKINENMNLTQLLAQTDIDFSTTNVANLLVDKSYGQTYASAANVIRSAGSWSKVDDAALKWGVKDRDSFMHALVAVLRPLYGVLDVLLNDASLGLFDIVYIPGSNGYTSSIVPLLEAFSTYNIKTQYQYRQDISKEYDAILLDIINPIWDLVEDVLSAPLQTVTKILPNLALFIGNNGLVQIIDNLLTPISALIDAIRPVIDLNTVLTAVLDSLNVDLNKYLGMVGITNFKLDLYDLNKTLKPVLSADALIPLVNNALGLIDLGGGTKIDLKLNDVDWLKLASHGKTIVGASQAATYGSRIYVEGDSAETLMAVLTYLIETINTGDNYDKVNALIGGLIGGGADDSMSDIISQVMTALKGDTDTVIANLVELLETIA